MPTWIFTATSRTGAKVDPRDLIVTVDRIG